MVHFVVAGAAKRHEVGAVVRPAAGNGQNVMHLVHDRHLAVLQALFTEWMLRGVTVADAFPGAAIFFVNMRGAFIFVVLPSSEVSVILAVKIVRQLWTAGIAAGLFGALFGSGEKRQMGVRTVFWTVLESKFGKRHIWIRNLFRVFFEMLILLIQIHVMNEI